jgi:C4-dicarboxylate transporter DctQ subunit
MGERFFPFLGVPNTKYRVKKMKIFDRIIGAMAFLAGILLLCAMLLVSYEVLMRYYFGQSVAWAIEICEDILLFITFLGTAWLLKNEGHVTVEIIYVRLNPKTQKVLDIMTSVIGIFICAILTWYSAGSTLDHFQRGATVIKSLTLPKAMLLVIIPIGFFTLTLQFLRRTHGYLLEWRKPLSKDPNLGKE